MLPTIHCSVPGCKSTCALSSPDRDRVAAALTERGWTVESSGKEQSTNARCPIHRDPKFAAPVVPVAPVPTSDAPGA